LFDTCDIRPEKRVAVETAATKIAGNQATYESAGSPLGVPWYFVGVVHNMESSLDFTRHLHNGDPLTDFTKHVPKNRPATGTPPFAWEFSAADALKLQKLDRVGDWSIPGLLFQLEKYNGFGYRLRHPEVLSPYLWSFCTHYTKGKFVADGTFSENAVSAQCGAAVILRRLAEKGVIRFDPDGGPIEDTDQPTDSEEASHPLVTFSETAVSETAKTLQKALNTFPGVFLRVDGVAGPKTSDALRRVTGNLLEGDPRRQSTAAVGGRIGG
jgi:lysozyme family protein